MFARRAWSCRWERWTAWTGALLLLCGLSWIRIDDHIDELAGAKRYQGGLYLLGNQVQGSVAANLARNWVNGLPPEALGEFVTKVNAVTAEGVQAAGWKYFLSGSQSVVVVGDAKAVRPQLELFGAVKDVKP